MANDHIEQLFKSSDQRSRDLRMLEEAKRREQKLINEGYRWVKTDKNTLVLRKVKQEAKAS